MKYPLIALFLVVAIAASGQTKKEVRSLHEYQVLLKKESLLDYQVKSLIKEVHSLMDDQSHLVGAWDRSIRENSVLQDQIDSLKEKLNLVVEMSGNMLNGSLSALGAQVESNNRLDSLIDALRKPIFQSGEGGMQIVPEFWRSTLPVYHWDTPFIWNDSSKKAFLDSPRILYRLPATWEPDRGEFMNAPLDSIWTIGGEEMGIGVGTGISPTRIDTAMMPTATPMARKRPKKKKVAL